MQCALVATRIAAIHPCQASGLVLTGSANSPREEKKRRRRTTLITVLVGVVAIIVILILLWLLRGCAPSQTTSSTSSSSGSAVADVVLANRVHTAIHPIQLGNGTLADTLIYIIDVTRQGKNVVATLRLDVSTTDFSRDSRVGGGARPRARVGEYDSRASAGDHGRPGRRFERSSIGSMSRK